MSRILQKYCDKVDQTLRDHELTGRVTGGNVDRERGIVTMRAPIDCLTSLRRDLARVLGVRGCRLFIVIEVRVSDQ